MSIPVAPVELDRGDSIEKVKFEDQKVVLENLELSFSCLFSAGGLLCLIVGFAFLMAEQQGVAMIIILSGAGLIAMSLARRVLKTWKRHQAHDSSKRRQEASPPSSSPRSPRRKEAAVKPTPVQIVKPLSFDHVVNMAIVTTLPNVFLVYFFSAVGIGVEVFGTVAPYIMNLLGDTAVSLGSIAIGVLLVFDWLNWRPLKKTASALLPFLLLVCGNILKGGRYAWLPIVTVMLLVPLGLFWIRATSCRNVKRASFYKAAGICIFLNNVVLLAAWLVWISVGENEWDSENVLRLRETSDVYEYVYRLQPLSYGRHCGREGNVTAFLPTERQDVREACSTASTIFLFAYASPFVAFACNGAMMAFCFLGRAMPELYDPNHVQQVLQCFGMAAISVVAMFLGTAYVACASFRLGETLLAILAAFLVAMLVWGYVELDNYKTADFMSPATTSRTLYLWWRSDWSKAFILSCLNILIPVGALLSFLNMKVRRRQKRPNTEAKFTPLVEKILEQLESWNWVSILSKICALAEIAVISQLGLAKFASVFFARLNAEFNSFSFAVTVALAVLSGTGALLFMPLVPGIPVYVFIGFTVVQRGRSLDSVGFAGSATISIIVCYLMKLASSIVLYLVGFALGRSTSIQQLVGVNTVFTRGVEKTLKERRLGLGKVCILVGSPDWPISVLCGILRIGLVKMLWGTYPVFVLICPCVLSGAFLSRVTEGEDSIWNLLSNATVCLGSIVNGLCMLFAAYHLLTLTQRHEHELQQPRREHSLVEERCRQHRAWQDSYFAVTKWHSLARCWKAFIALAAVLHIVNLFIITFMYEVCFKNFSLISNVDKLPDGLHGNILDHALKPLGYAVAWTAAIATLLHFFFILCMCRSASLHLRCNRAGVGEQSAASRMAPSSCETPEEDVAGDDSPRNTDEGDLQDGGDRKCMVALEPRSSRGVHPSWETSPGLGGGPASRRISSLPEVEEEDEEEEDKLGAGPVGKDNTPTLEEVETPETRGAGQGATPDLDEPETPGPGLIPPDSRQGLPSIEEVASAPGDSPQESSPTPAVAGDGVPGNPVSRDHILTMQL